MEFSLPVDPLAELRRLYREACRHQFANESAAATAILQNVLPERMRQLQQAHPISLESVQAALEEEYRRVLDAEVLGEFLLPRLQQNSVRGAMPAAKAPVSARTAAAPPASGVQSITDMLDSMLTQESARPPRSR